MRYNFRRLPGREWFDTINGIRARGTSFLEVPSIDLYDKTKVGKPCYAYYSTTNTSCKIIYYEMVEGEYKKRLREISFSDKFDDPAKCMIVFRNIAKKYNEAIPYEDNHKYTNGVYTYFKSCYSGYVTVLDMNSAYLYALTQPLADWETRTEVDFDSVYNGEYDFYCFENGIHSKMFYKEDYSSMLAAHCWADVKIYGYKSRLYYQQTAKELYRLKCEVNKKKYKNVANIAVGCMHKHSGVKNNTTVAASLYAWFEWYIDDLVAKFEKKGYNVIMVTTDSIKIKGHYNQEDNLVSIGDGLGEFKIEYEGEAKYHSVGHYEENKVKWKGKPEYMIDGYEKCMFIDNLEEELPIYEKYAKI